MAPGKSFIETQFPVSKLSKESYKERKANYSQTLTGLGKWWGRKPLVTVRALILGLLIPTSDDPKKDTEVFLRLMTMDEDGLWRRKTKAIAVEDVYHRLSDDERKQYFQFDEDSGKVKYLKGITPEEKEALQRQAFAAMSYDEKLEYCCRPEQIDGPSEASWVIINAHLGTSSTTLKDLVRELGERCFGEVPKVGDVFCGGGSVPFEAARIGCEAYGSDLNPVAALLTWGSLNVLGGDPKRFSRIERKLADIYRAVDLQVSEWGIEHNERGWRADAYLYCAEATCPECHWSVPLAPSWVIGEKTKAIAKLIPNKKTKGFDFEVLSGVSPKEMAEAKNGTSASADLRCPHCKTPTPISTIRGDRRTEDGKANGLRAWEKTDIIPRPGDIFRERLYCVRYVEHYVDERGRDATRKHYCAPTEKDLKREEKVLKLLQERLDDWQRLGYLPSSVIEPGEKTDEPIRTRGWTHWHHLFNPRQLLLLGEFFRTAMEVASTHQEKAIAMLCVGRLCNWNSKLSRWHPHAANEKGEDTFSNQALNTLHTHATRAFSAMETAWMIENRNITPCNRALVEATEGRDCRYNASIWITDPPYADAINYAELSEFFLAWYCKQMHALFPTWSTDSKRALSVRGSGTDFLRNMIEVYRHLSGQMPDNGMQVVMFTHQDVSVWANLALILWASGLRVTAAWTIGTETPASGFKKGNYVQGTVLLVLRKRSADEMGFLDEIISDVRPEVERQLASMLAIDDQDDPNFSDSDYQLAAYAAALRVLTQYNRIEEIDVEREIMRQRTNGDRSPIEGVIENAVKIASNFLIPRGLHDDEATRRDLWRNLSAEEKFYLKGLDIEGHGDLRQGVYQEFARGFGLREYTNLLESSRANETRLKTATEFKRRELGAPGFGSSLLRNILFAVCKVREDERLDQGMRWLKDETPGNYWQQRSTIITLLRYLANLPMEHWKEDAEASRLLAGAVENDSV